MESEQKIKQAKSVIRSLLQNHTKRHSRVHTEAVDENAQRLRALENLCGRCANLKIDLKRINGKSGAVLKCRKNFSPLELYINTPLGETAKCEGFPGK